MTIDRFLLWGTRGAIGLILLEPLVMGPFGLTFSLWPKALFFRALVEIAFIFYIFLLWRNPREYMPRFSVLAWALTAFVGAVLLASVFGIHFSQSFWGDAYRTEGFIFYFHLLVFFFILSGVLSKKAEWLWLFRGVVGAGAIASVLGLLQAFHISPPFVYMVDPGRVSSTLANPVFFGGYLTLFLFIGLLLFLEEKKGVVRFAVSAAVALGLAALILSGTRGAWVGLGLGLAVFFGSVLFFAGANRRLVLKIGVFVLLGLVLAGIVLVNIPAAQEWRIIQRATHFPIGELQSRLVGWTVAFDAFKERPLFGWGPESFVILFDKFFKPEYVIAIGENTFFDRAHNQPLHLLATTGLVGLVSYLFVFFAFGWAAWQKRAIFGHPFAVFAIWAFLVGSFTQNLFAFDTISTSVLFFLLAAFVHTSHVLRTTNHESQNTYHKTQITDHVTRNTNHESHITNHESQDKMIRDTSIVSHDADTSIVNRGRAFSIFLLLSYLIFALTLLWQINIKPMHAALLIVQGARAEQTDASRSLATYKQALSQKTVYDTSFRVAVVDRLVRRFDDEKSPEMKKEMAEMLAGLKPQIERDLGKLPRAHASGYELLFGINEKIYMYSGNMAYLLDMERVAKEAIALNPRTPRFYHLSGRAAILKGDYERGEALHLAGYELTPRRHQDAFEYYFQAGLSYTKAGERVKSSAYMRHALEERYTLRKENPEVAYDVQQLNFAVKVAAQFCELGDVGTCLELFEGAKEAYPPDREYFQGYIDTIQEKLSE